MSKYRIHLLTALVVLTAMMQVVVLYRQPRPREVTSLVTNAPKNFHFDLVDFPVMGSADAKVVILEFLDYQCPFCARQTTTVLPAVKEQYIDRGLVRYAVGNNPLDAHPDAKRLARFAICAGEQGRYWEAHDRLFSKPNSASAGSPLAAEVGVDESRFNRCLDSDTPAQAVFARDQDLVRRLGLAGTPAFTIGRIESGKRMRVERIINGAVGIDLFTRVIDQMLGPQQKDASASGVS